MRCDYACQGADHRFSRRGMLGGMLGGAVGAMGLGAGSLGLNLGGLVLPARAEEIAKAHKRVLVVFMHGGVSQLETWDPKPNTDTGGPFRAISTSVPGIQISELLPYTAQQMHRLTLVRGVNTAEDDHGKGAYMMETGRRETPIQRYPTLGSAAMNLLGQANPALPGYIHVQPGGGGYNKSDAAFLGARYAAVAVDNGKAPANLARPDHISEIADQGRQAARKKANARFSARRRTASTEAYDQSFDQAAQLMQRADLFDIGKESAADQDRYGGHDFGRHCLLARRLLENGVTCVKLTHTNYDTHFENFDFHIEQLGEFDRPFANLVADLVDRGLWESTLVVVISEFGRTPHINHLAGRDHWSKAWSVALGGCGLKPGTVIGKTNDNGTEVIDHQVNAGHLFHTYYRALGLDPTSHFALDGRTIPLAEPADGAIHEILA